MKIIIELFKLSIGKLFVLIFIKCWWNNLDILFKLMNGFFDDIVMNYCLNILFLLL